MVTRQEEATPSRVHLTTYFNVAAGLCLPFVHKRLSITTTVENIDNEEGGMIPGFVMQMSKPLPQSCTNMLERSVKLSLCFM